MFHEGTRTSSTLPNKSAVRRVSIISLQISTENWPNGLETTVRRNPGLEGGRNFILRLRNCSASTFAGKRLVHGQVATDAVRSRQHGISLIGDPTASSMVPIFKTRDETKGTNTGDVIRHNSKPVPRNQKALEALRRHLVFCFRAF